MKRIQNKLLMLGLLVSVFTLSLSAQAFAHVVVKPGEVATGAFQTFTVSVPNEKGAAVTAVKLEIPDSLAYVTPSVKNGWTIEAEKTGTGEAAKTKSITWSGSTIPVGYRDDFTFSAKVPEKATELHWNATQTYEDGVVVTWTLSEDEQPKKADGSPDFSTSGPYSITKVADTNETIAAAGADETARNKADTSTTLALAAVAVSLLSLYFATRKPKSKK